MQGDGADIVVAGDKLGPHLDHRAACVHGVLGKLAEAVQRRGKLGDQVVDEAVIFAHGSLGSSGRCAKSNRSDFGCRGPRRSRDRKSTRLNSSHVRISYAVFCLKKKTTKYISHYTLS